MFEMVLRRQNKTQNKTVVKLPLDTIFLRKTKAATIMPTDPAKMEALMIIPLELWVTSVAKKKFP